MTNEQGKHIITVNDVSVKTMSIEVKVMTLNKKQVTLAVFRQLEDEQILDTITGTLRGIPWGRVNYHPDCSKEMKPHFHIVWQKGEELRRSAIDLRWQAGPSKDILEILRWEGGNNAAAILDFTIEAYLTALALTEGIPDEKQREKGIDVSLEGWNYRVDPSEVSTHLTSLWKTFVERAQRQRRVKRWQEEPGSTMGRESFLQREQDALKKAEAEWRLAQKASRDWLIKNAECPEDPRAVYQNHVLPAYQNYLRYFKQWRDSYTQLQALDQLFIAV